MNLSFSYYAIRKTNDELFPDPPISEEIETSLHDPFYETFPCDIVILGHPDLTFDDVKHLLYGGVKFLLFELGDFDETDKFYELYKYSKERFPGKIFDNEAELDEYLINNNIRPNKEEYLSDKSKSLVPFSEFKLNQDGLIPVIAQDYKTNEVLMMAYMNEESYQKTLDTGLMTYWSRSRQKLWTKGEESGHIQKMVSLTIDCDKDTILAKVDQTGPACHTGNPTCFFTPLTNSDQGHKNSSLSVFEEVYNVIMDRKKNPREGSYTNYLFDKGIDKILKKVGEECTEIVIAAKNPGNEEIKYEIADYLYHLMVLMAECGVTWEDITDELSRREG